MPFMTMNMMRLTEVGITINIKPINDFLINFSNETMTPAGEFDVTSSISKVEVSGDSGLDVGTDALLNDVTPMKCLVKVDNEAGGWISARVFTKVMSCQTNSTVSQRLIQRSNANSAPATLGCSPMRHLLSAPICAIDDHSVYAMTAKIPAETILIVMM